MAKIDGSVTVVSGPQICLRTYYFKCKGTNEEIALSVRVRTPVLVPPSQYVEPMRGALGSWTPRSYDEP